MTEAGDLLPCWTCREANWCEITHTSSEHPGTLYRCVNCKAVYPDFALQNTRAPITPSDRSQRAVVEVERILARGYNKAADAPAGWRIKILAGTITKARAAIAALQPPAADNATRKPVGEADV